MKYLALTDGWQFNRLLKTKPQTATNGQSRILERVHQIFPLTLFPDELIVEELRVVWIRRRGPWTSEIVSIMATDIACVYAARGLIFGSLHIKNVTGGPEICLGSLLGKDAYKTRNLIEGIALASREGLQLERTANLEKERNAILRVGQVRSSFI